MNRGMRPLLALVLLLGACRIGPGRAPTARELEISALVANLGDPAADARLVQIGEAAVPALLKFTRESPDPIRRGRSARVLGLMYRMGTNRAALSAYVALLKEGNSAAVARDLLGSSYLFNDSEGAVRTLLLEYLEKMPGATPEMITSAAALDGAGVLEGMTSYVYRTKHLESDPGREIAVRAIGRDARRGRKEAVEFLVNCTLVENESLVTAAQRELRQVCGPVEVESWRGWWLEHATETRAHWIASAMGREKGKAFDPSDLAAWGELIGGLDSKGEAEPVFALVEEHIGIRFGYVSPRDVFDPMASDVVLENNNRRAVELLKSWWKDNSAKLIWRAGPRQFRVDPTGQVTPGEAKE